MQRDICFSTWPACTAPDEESGEPFQAANPNPNPNPNPYQADAIMLRVRLRVS